MRGYRRLIPLMAAPYCIIAAFFFLIIGPLYLGESSYVIVAAALVLLVLAYVFASIATLAFFIGNLRKMRAPLEILRINMIIKISHTVAYIIIFLLGILFFMTIFTFAFSILLIILDVVTIALSGTIGVAGILNCEKTGIMSNNTAIFCSVLQYIYCIDVIAAIGVYVIVKSKAPGEDQWIAGDDAVN